MGDFISFIGQHVFNAAEVAVKTVYPSAPAWMVELTMGITTLIVVGVIALWIVFRKSAAGSDYSIKINGKGSFNNSGRIGHDIDGGKE